MKRVTEIKERYFWLLSYSLPFIFGKPEEIEQHLKEYHTKFDKLVEKGLAAECERYYYKDNVQVVKTLAWVLNRDIWKDCEKLYKENNKE